jgi:hypothetical protein
MILQASRLRNYCDISWYSQHEIQLLAKVNSVLSKNLKNLHKFKLLRAVKDLSLGHKVVKSNKKLHKTLSMLFLCFQQDTSPSVKRINKCFWGLKGKCYKLHNSHWWLYVAVGEPWSRTLKLCNLGSTAFIHIKFGPYIYPTSWKMMMSDIWQ